MAIFINFDKEVAQVSRVCMRRQNAVCLAGGEQKKITSPSVLNLEILFQMLYGFQGTVLYQRGILKLIYKSNL